MDTLLTCEQLWIGTKLHELLTTKSALATKSSLQVLNKILYMLSLH